MTLIKLFPEINLNALGLPNSAKHSQSAANFFVNNRKHQFTSHSPSSRILNRFTGINSHKKIEIYRKTEKINTISC